MIECDTQQLFILAIGALGLGMYMLLRGGGWTVDAAVFVARRLGISPLVIGFTVVAMGTSLPELIVSINANMVGSAGIVTGNVIGSNIANILFVLGVTAFYTTLTVLPRALMRDLVMMMFATLLMMGFMLYGDITRLAGMSMIAIIFSYVFWQYWLARKGKIDVEDMEEPQFKSMVPAVGFLIAGLACIALGAEFLVRGAKVTATIIGVPEDVIGLSVIALGTSLPELSTCLIAAMKRHTDIVIGNIVGSNVFNILLIIGVTALVKPIQQAEIAPQVISLDIWVMFAVSAIFTVILLLYRKLNRGIGILFILAYILYISAIYGLYLGRDLIPQG
ncbi:MAG: calcium/sodium antiporter [Rhodospirillales bacterium]|nr:calcium/sodium antiporter [Alphaproteobacteria bacterium]USO04237.1 MAG: calcium/sodium antiporter [Rhodospirillales bacterium]